MFSVGLVIAIFGVVYLILSLFLNYWMFNGKFVSIGHFSCALGLGLMYLNRVLEGVATAAFLGIVFVSLLIFLGLVKFFDENVKDVLNL